MARYARDFGGRGIPRRNEIPHDYAIDYGYRRGGFTGSRGPSSGSRMGSHSMGGGFGQRQGMAAGRYGGGGQWTAYGSGDMGVTFGNRANNFGGGSPGGGMGGGEIRRGYAGGRGMRYDIGYGFGDDRKWF